ncbi:MAG: antibiotic biosynthesis monooxygenase [Bacteroidota bacterium]|nr:antibiotic biosynthesis monooxygenase [Bacteroidota bacterium]
MKKRIALFQIFLVVSLTLFFSESVFAQDKKLVIRIAKLKIDPVQLASYKVALKEEMEISVRIEPGVLSLYALADKSDPASITIFEIYANEDAYNAHRETAHFKKYKTGTKDMVKSLELLDTDPIALDAKKDLSLN